ncbi:ABC transporter family substrate-binding protein [Corynebacterium sp. H127]|uniref:ABC transporter family substrate-binding protein n=1 Tax=Corynebacterium sp. H127 TaxID=3133418 RepID=UPI0030ABDF48
MKLPSIRVGAAVAVATLAAGCAAQPGPAPIQQEDAPTTAQVTVTPEVPADKKNREELVIGIDTVTNGFNPHLLADDSAFVQSLAQLVLPSAFYDGDMNSDLLVSAAEIEPSPGAVQTVQYRIKNEAQWSDGSPVTGADFHYLWSNLRSQPGVIDPAGYQAMKDVRTSEGGKLVTVDFSRRIDAWQQLFQNLLPSHLLSIGTESFDRVMATQVPASAGRYMVRTIDRRRGVIELARNDRFWGKDTADVELLTFRETTNVSQAAEMLRTGQLSFAHLTPAETTLDSLRLAQGLQVRTVDRDSVLGLSFNTATLHDASLRKTIASAIDVPLAARLAAGRSSDLALADSYQAGPLPRDEAAIASAQQLLGRPLKIAVDPAEDSSRDGAIAIADMLRRAGFSVEIIQTDFKDITAQRISKGEVDLVVGWQRQPDDALTAAGRYSCATEGIVADNLSMWCDKNTEQYFAEALARNASKEEIHAYVTELNSAEMLSLPIMRDKRVDVLSSGIVGPAPQLDQWPVVADSSVLSTAHKWKEK